MSEWEKSRNLSIQKNPRNLSKHKITQPLNKKITQPVHQKKIMQPLHKKIMQALHKKITQPLHKNYFLAALSSSCSLVVGPSVRPSGYVCEKVTFRVSQGN